MTVWATLTVAARRDCAPEDADTAALRERLRAAEARLDALRWADLRSACLSLGRPDNGQVGAQVGWLIAGHPKADGSDIIGPPVGDTKAE